MKTCLYTLVLLTVVASFNCQKDDENNPQDNLKKYQYLLNTANGTYMFDLDGAFLTLNNCMHCAMSVYGDYYYTQKGYQITKYDTTYQKIAQYPIPVTIGRPNNFVMPMENKAAVLDDEIDVVYFLSLGGLVDNIVPLADSAFSGFQGVFGTMYNGELVIIGKGGKQLVAINPLTYQKSILYQAPDSVAAFRDIDSYGEYIYLANSRNIYRLDAENELEFLVTLPKMIFNLAAGDDQVLASCFSDGIVYTIDVTTKEYAPLLTGLDRPFCIKRYREIK
jgi:hypothetical protein